MTWDNDTTQHSNMLITFFTAFNMQFAIKKNNSTSECCLQGYNLRLKEMVDFTSTHDPSVNNQSKSASYVILISFSSPIMQQGQPVTKLYGKLEEKYVFSFTGYSN
jgi:hypothetical protein